MKTTILSLMFLFCATAAFGQYGSAVTPPTLGEAYSSPNHPEHAQRESMGEEMSLFEANSVVIGHGEMPLWEVPLKSHEVPLGDSARALRQEHARDKKAQIVWANN